jgi:hypothetical protein
VDIVAGQPVRCVKVSDALAKCTLLTLQPLGSAFPGSQLDQKGFHQRRHRRVTLSRDHTSTPKSLVIE